MEDLGSIDGGTTPTTSTVTTTYWGSKIQTHQTVKGVARDRYEWKNVLGKVSQVQDAAGGHIWYTYDPDGNLTGTTDPVGNTVLITYDVLGRKKTTQDPDLGTWGYAYNGFGDLISQTDAKNQTTTMTYDQLGRMTTKTDPAAGTAEWVYDQATAGGSAGIGKLAAMISAPDPNLKGPCAIPYTTQTSGNRAGRSFTYTPFGDVAQVDECIDSDTFSTNYQYDNLGRQSVVTYPNVQSARFAAEYHYTSLGFLQYVADASDHTPYWVAESMDATGQVAGEYTRNGVETVSTRNLSTGWLMDATTTAVADSNTLIQHWTNTYDEVGNLRSRARSQPTNMADSIESFGYDHLDRLTSAEVKIPSESYDVTESYAYDSIGNLTHKGGKAYTYTGCTAGGGPHAVCTVDGSPGYSYDRNGNMVAGNGRTVAYNSFNKVSYITGNQSASDGSSPTVRFMYGADGNRVVQSVGTTAASETARTVYVGMGGTGKSMYERTTHSTSGVTEHVLFLYAGGAHGGNAFALRVVTAGTQAGSNSSSDPPDTPTVAMRYQHFDHLGSVTASTDENGRVVGALGGAETTVFGYDAWGARRSPDGRPATGALDLQVGHREFTGHETIPSVGLVNMNGRVYDPELGRFLTPDPTVQFVADLQSYNRYSYVLNNPLRYTDPTGTFLGGAFDIFVNAVILVATVVVCAYSVGAGCVAGFALLATIYNTSSMMYSGVPFDQAIGIGLWGMAAGIVGGGAGAAFAQGIGLAEQSMATAVVAGAIAGAYSSTMTTLAYANGRGLGQNMLLGAASGALGAALAWSAQATNPVSQAAEADASGGGAGQTSGAEKAAAVETAGATTGRPGSLTAADLENIVEGNVPDASNVPSAAMTRAEAAARYGAIDPTQATAAGQWPGSRQSIVRYDIPDEIVNDPDYHWTVRGRPVTTVYTNSDVAPMLDTALKNLQEQGSLGELDTYNGSWAIRQTTGSGSLSAHSWGIAIDINAASNPLGAPPTMSPAFVSAFTDAGFTWGGNWSRPDGMHFSLGF